MRQLMIRQLNMIAEVRTEETRTGRFPDGAWGRMSRAGRELWSTDLLHIDETPSPSIEDVIAKCMLMKQRVPALQYIFVDYFQLMRQEARRTGDLESSELKAVAQGLLHIAKSLEVVTVALVQPNDKQIKDSPGVALRAARVPAEALRRHGRRRLRSEHRESARDRNRQGHAALGRRAHARDVGRSRATR
jgi:replicative DNA helicase